MRIYYAGDVHLEFGDGRIFKESVAKNNFNFDEFFNDALFPNQRWMRKLLNETEPRPDDILILAGDSFFHHENFFKNNVLKKLTSYFKEVYLIPGNHEYYHPKTNISVLMKPFKKKVTKNSWYVNNKKIYINDWKIILTPLFSHIKEVESFWVERGMNDFKLINFDGEKYTYKHHNLIHDKCVKFLKKELKEEINTIVVSHHLPTFAVVDSIHRGSTLGPAFAVELSELILDNPHIKYWVYGHSHADVNLKIGETQILSNQAGYASEWGEPKLKFDKFIEI